MKNMLYMFYFLGFSFILTACGGGDEENSGKTNTTFSTGSVIGDGAIDIGWNIPTSKNNGDPLSLSEIGGYKVYVSTVSNYIPSIPYANLSDSTTASYTISNLPSDTYYIYVTTYDVNGDESPYSEPVKKTI